MIPVQFVTEDRRLLGTYIVQQVPSKGEVVTLTADRFIGTVTGLNWTIGERSNVEAVVLLQAVRVGDGVD